MINTIPREEFDTILFNAFRAIIKFQHGKVKRFNLCFEDIYLMQYLRHNSPACMKDIAEEINIPISTATRVVDRLESRKFLSRIQDRVDRRNMLVSLKKAGNDIVQAVEDHTFSVISENLKNISKEDLNAYKKTTLAMEKILSLEHDSD